MSRAPERLIVLVVEDEPLLLLYAMDIVAEEGFEPLSAVNADKAIRILESRDDIRVVFTDINMPGSMDGLKLAHAIRHRWPPVEVIITSGYVMTLEQDLPSRGRFIRKPYKPSEISGALRELARFD